MKANELHRIHLGHDPEGKGWRVDVNGLEGGNWRYEGQGGGDVRKAMALRIAVTWNVCEGIPTQALLAGVVRDFYETARSLAALLERGIAKQELTADELQPFLKRLREADKAHAITGVDCNCSEHSPKDKKRRAA